MFQEHRQIHGTTREPLLENITSDYDLELFRKAQARASEDLVRLHIPCTSHLTLQTQLTMGTHFTLWLASHQIVNKLRQ